MTPDLPRPASGLEPGSLSSFLDFLWRHRALIVGMVGVATLAAVMTVLVVPKEYTARAVLLPRTEEESGLLSTAMSLLGGDLPSLPLSGLTGGFGIAAAVARSERLADAINERLQLDTHYNSKRRESRLRRWYSVFNAKTSPQGMLVLTYRDRDPRFAANVLDAVIAEVERIQTEIRTTAGRRQREFLTERVRDTRARLSALEDSLAAYQSDHQGAMFSAGTESAVQAGADLLTERVRLETEVQILRRTLGPGAPGLRAKELEIASLDAELAKLPALGSGVTRLTRDLKVQEGAYAFLSAQLEDARLKESRDTPQMQVLDPPVVPTQKSHPQRALTVLIVLVVSTKTALLSGLLLDAVRRVREVRRV